MILITEQKKAKKIFICMFTFILNYNRNQSAKLPFSLEIRVTFDCLRLNILDRHNASRFIYLLFHKHHGCVNLVFLIL